jgi:hypothetical protein
MQTKQIHRSHSPVRAVDRKPFFSQQNNFFQPTTIERSVSDIPDIQKQGTNETGNTRPRAVPQTPRALPPLQAPLRDNEGPGPVLNIPPDFEFDLGMSDTFRNCFSNSPLAQRLILHYSRGSGAPYRLDADQMRATNALIQLQTSDQFNALRRNGTGERDVRFSSLARALTAGTLHTFTVNYRGRLTISQNGRWHFAGRMSWQDRFDFDPRPLGNTSFDRRPHGEEQVRIAAMFLRGRGFNITSEEVAVEQSFGDYCASWLGFSSTNQPVDTPMNSACQSWLDDYRRIRP